MFDNTFTRELPADPEQRSFRRQVEQACYPRVQPAVVSESKIIAFAREVAELIDLPDSECNSKRSAEVFSGNALLDGMDPYAMCYGSHQLGSWAGQCLPAVPENIVRFISRCDDCTYLL